MTIKHFLSTHLKSLKWVIFCYFHNISRNCHFVTHFDIPKKLGRKSLIVTNFYPAEGDFFSESSLYRYSMKHRRLERKITDFSHWAIKYNSEGRDTAKFAPTRLKRGDGYRETTEIQLLLFTAIN